MTWDEISKDKNIKCSELRESMFYNFMKLSDKNYRLLAKREISKYIPSILYKEAKTLLPSLQRSNILRHSMIGIRPQLVNKKTYELELDFMVERGEKSIHILNSVSPAFTSSLAFAKYVVKMLSKNNPSKI
jgi:L-2-hydroxyglutarate oxidase LhgO